MIGHSVILWKTEWNVSTFFIKSILLVLFQHSFYVVHYSCVLCHGCHTGRCVHCNYNPSLLHCICSEDVKVNSLNQRKEYGLRQYDCESACGSLGRKLSNAGAISNQQSASHTNRKISYLCH